MLPNSEWILLGLLAVILLKPKDIPVMAKSLARIIRKAQRLWNDLVLTDDEHTFTFSDFPSPTNHKEGEEKHPFHLSPPKAKSQPVKD